MQESPKNETSRPIKNASNILRSGQRFLATHVFWGTILYCIYFNSASGLCYLKELVLVEL